ncbi:uncharacterized protein [Glycine max]|uniref:uncharacterized protein n=1 Tax=Glycine max TaxID=3847 RepID=UPI000719253C|nr:uncharacterized protein LOC106794175 [Glycine max]|eukprot:XP_014620136.1 uncharacterized protein LOC106794175 [Glycine max]
MSGHRLHRALSKLKLIEEENDQRSQDARGIHRRHIHRRSRRHLRLLRRAKAQAVKVLAVLFTLRTETKVRVQARLSGQLLLSVQSSQQRRSENNIADPLTKRLTCQQVFESSRGMRLKPII